MKTSLRVLIVEDSEFDAQMMIGLLRKEGYQVHYERVETAESLKSSLARASWDIILADYNLPEFNAMAALAIVRESGQDLPFIIVSGGIGEDIAVAAMKAGAHDYLMKGNLSRLAPAVERELREAAIRSSQREAKRALLESEMRYRLLWENSPDGVVLLDPQGKIHFANPAVRKIFGFAPEEVVGKNLHALESDINPGAHQNVVDDYLRTGVNLFNGRAVETTGRRKDGQEIQLEISFSDMELNGERRFVGFIRDITDRKQAEAALQDHAEQFRVARDIQQRLFPKTAPHFAGFDIAGGSWPAEATGGDYYDFLPMLHNGQAIIIGDVTGHGIGPALLMAETRAYLRVLVGRREDVGEILTRANGILAEDVGTERFITLFLARLESNKPFLTYASAGHAPGFHLNAQGRLKRSLPRTGVPLGMRPDTQYVSSSEIPLETGDILLLLTDGIEEAMAMDDTMFGAERAVETVRENRHLTAKEIVQALYRAVREFSDNTPQIDDITAIVVKVL